MSKVKRYDCPLCPAGITATRYTLVLLGMFVCDACAKRWLMHKDCLFKLPHPTVMAWLHQVHHLKLKHMVGERVARRLVLADYMGLEVDVDELAREYTTPWTT